ncbi:HAMP domain-containing protein [Verminephrobacter aporrectodeae subsp. tuberculatae]|uniref:histidine kinase n=1 Tax=Verminephrobacter aporrectodeae subsp. tuberculatae TaxID=1110392 RepID=A0ABT3KUP2_9BURK|nr:sensor histidine kinase [Verminephrobacter aporrectodeae]MCW5321515.1 HAMP domain-containing protein [Verminephrobacter aporrectodeae subsp. tuberculatae]
MSSALRTRLPLMLALPLCLLMLVGLWLDYRAAGEAAGRYDQLLAQLLPALAESVRAPEPPGRAPRLLPTPPLQDFLQRNAGVSGYSVRDRAGRLLLGDAWVRGALPATQAPEFHSLEFRATTYRVAMQRARTGAGELVLALADGSDPQQQWVRQLLMRVLLPNLALLIATGLVIHWAVRQAVKPLVGLAAAVARRSPQDLRPIDEAASPDEVRPLVHSLNRLFALVDAQAEAQRRFVADAAHQLRTPLAGLQAQVEAWAMAARAAPAQKTPAVSAQHALGAIVLGTQQIEKLRHATRRTSQLAHQLLTLSCADARSLAVQPPQRVDLKDLCESVLEAFLDAATGKGLDLGLEAQPVQATGHGGLLRELLSNLVDNAVKYTPAGGVVTIRCGWRLGHAGAPQACVEVEDDGPGVPDGEHARVLQRFYRLPGAGGEGTGLGLAIADEIARTHSAVLNLACGPQGRGLLATVLFSG